MKIKKTGKIIIIFYVFLAISVIILLLNNEILLDQPGNKSEIGSDLLHSCSYWELLTSACEWHESSESWSILPSPISELENTRNVFHHKEEAFLIMTDVKNYPKILPKNIVSVNIINRVDNTVLAEYELIEHGIRTKLLAEHTMYPYDKHILEIMDGDAKGTKLIQDFTTVECNESVGKCTQIASRVELNLGGILAPFGFLPKLNLDHAFNTIITSFEMYMDTYENGTKKIIDDLYREILLRPVDAEAFEYWGSLLESGAMTEADIRTEILNSDEKKWLLLLSKDIKKVEELDDETKKIIDDLYREILLRPADAEAFEYWGSLLESEEITNLELRKAILKSQEAIALKRYNSENIVLIYDVFNMVYEMSGPYLEDGMLFFDPRIDQNEFKKMVEKNKYRLNIEEITVDELRLELEQLKENGIDFLVDDLESVQEQFLDWQKRFVDKTHDFCYYCKWGPPTEH